MGTNNQDYFIADVTLNSGYKMPVLGIGTYALSDSQAENSVYHALKDGYRLIDTANVYMNERGVGREIKKAVSEGICKREDIFLTTKLWPSEYKYDDVLKAIDETLARLDTDYIDLLLLHQQYGEYIDAYKAMEKAVELGKSWFPLGGIENKGKLLENEIIKGIANEHGKTTAQVILRWHIQNDYVAIPGSADEKEIAENFDIFDFELTDDDMEKMAKLDTETRFFTMSEQEQETAFTSFAPDFNNQK